MFNFIKNLFTTEEENDVFKIAETNGRYFIVNARSGFSVTGTGSYSRRRDAVRGAQRRGLSLA